MFPCSFSHFVLCRGEAITVSRWWLCELVCISVDAVFILFQWQPCSRIGCAIQTRSLASSVKQNVTIDDGQFRPLWDATNVMSSYVLRFVVASVGMSKHIEFRAWQKKRQRLCESKDVEGWWKQVDVKKFLEFCAEVRTNGTKRNVNKDTIENRRMIERRVSELSADDLT